MSVEIEAHTVPNFKAPIYFIMEYEGLEHAGTFTGCPEPILHF